MGEEHRKVRSDSDELMSALDELKRLESDKRTEDISTPRFHDLADRVEDQARTVFEMAANEERDGDEAPRASLSIDEVDPDE